MKAGKSASWYNVVKLSGNEKPGDAGPGDRLLALFMGLDAYLFVS